MIKSFTPREIVSELDRFIVGQQKAKRAVAIALRNRWRRLQVPEHLRDEILPKNILMIGPTGVGKTEIARRLAKLADAPFLKVEATKFTEVGYVGRDVEQIIRDLAEIAISAQKERKRNFVICFKMANLMIGKLTLKSMMQPLYKCPRSMFPECPAPKWECSAWEIFLESLWGTAQKCEKCSFLKRSNF